MGHASEESLPDAGVAVGADQDDVVRILPTQDALDGFLLRHDEIVRYAVPWIFRKRVAESQGGDFPVLPELWRMPALQAEKDRELGLHPDGKALRNFERVHALRGSVHSDERTFDGARPTGLDPYAAVRSLENSACGAAEIDQAAFGVRTEEDDVRGTLGGLLSDRVTGLAEDDPQPTRERSRFQAVGLFQSTQALGQPLRGFGGRPYLFGAVARAKFDGVGELERAVAQSPDLLGHDDRMVGDGRIADARKEDVEGSRCCHGVANYGTKVDLLISKMECTGAIAVLMVAIGLTGCRGPAGAADTTGTQIAAEEARSSETQTTADSRNAVTWVPEPATGDSFDWIQLKSGEWLKGELKLMRDWELEFDSKELGEQEFDWEDVLEVRTGRAYTARLVDENTATGRLWIRDGEVYLDDATEAAFDRSELFSITPSGDKRIEMWDGKVGMGLSLSRGNTDETDLSGFVDLRRVSYRSRLEIDYLGQYGEQDGELIANRHNQTTKLDIYVTERFYVTPVWLVLSKDEFQNIQLRATPAVGVGYQIYRDPRFDWDVSLAAGLQYVEFDSVMHGEDSSDETAAALFGMDVESDMTKDLDLGFAYDIQVSLDDAQDFYQDAIATLAFDLTDSIDLDISLIWHRVGQPTAESGGELPDKDDFSFVVGLGFEF